MWHETFSTHTHMSHTNTFETVRRHTKSRGDFRGEAEENARSKKKKHWPHLRSVARLWSFSVTSCSHIDRPLPAARFGQPPRSSFKGADSARTVPHGGSTEGCRHTEPHANLFCNVWRFTWDCGQCTQPANKGIGRWRNMISKHLWISIRKTKNRSSNSTIYWVMVCVWRQAKLFTHKPEEAQVNFVLIRM